MNSLDRANSVKERQLDEQFYSRMHALLRNGSLVPLGMLGFANLTAQDYKECGFFVLEFSKKGVGRTNSARTGHYDLFKKGLTPVAWVAYELNDKVINQISQNLMPPFTPKRKGMMVKRLEEAGLSGQWARYIVNEAAAADQLEASKKEIYEKIRGGNEGIKEDVRNAMRAHVKKFFEKQSEKIRDEYIEHIEAFHKEVEEERKLRRLRR